MHFQDFGPMTCRQPKNLDYIEPNAKYIESNPESRPGYSRLYHHKQTEIESILETLRKKKYNESQNFILIPHDFDVMRGFETFNRVEQRNSMLIDSGKVLESGKDIS